jgi:hypothetical protein
MSQQRIRQRGTAANTGNEVLISRKVMYAFSGSGPNEHFWKSSEMRVNKYMCSAPLHYEFASPERWMLEDAESQLRGPAERFQEGNALRIDCKRLTN